MPKLLVHVEELPERAPPLSPVNYFFRLLYRRATEPRLYVRATKESLKEGATSLSPINQLIRQNLRLTIQKLHFRAEE